MSNPFDNLRKQREEFEKQQELARQKAQRDQDDKYRKKREESERKETIRRNLVVQYESIVRGVLEDLQLAAFPNQGSKKKYDVAKVWHTDGLGWAIRQHYQELVGQGTMDMHYSDTTRDVIRVLVIFNETSGEAYHFRCEFLEPPFQTRKTLFGTRYERPKLKPIQCGLTKDALVIALQKFFDQLQG